MKRLKFIPRFEEYALILSSSIFFFGAITLQQQENVNAKLQLFKIESGNELGLKMDVCNETRRNIFIQNFSASAVHLRLFRFDSVKSEYIDYTRTFMNKWEGELFSEPYFGSVVEHKMDKGVVDSLTWAIIEGYKKTAGYDERFVSGSSKDAIYQSVDATRYFYPGEHQIETISLKSLGADGGKYKIYIKLWQRGTNKNDDTSNFTKFLTTIVPQKIKGFEKWENEINTDTLEFVIKKAR